jgi:hypothetical protein
MFSTFSTRIRSGLSSSSFRILPLARAWSLAAATRPRTGVAEQFCRVCTGAKPGDQKEGCRLVRAQ